MKTLWENHNAVIFREEKTSGSELPMGKGTVLIIEDEENIVSLISLYLKNEGFSVEGAADGEEGLAKFTELNPILVVLDIMLPGMDGWEVCKKIREKASTPIVMLTARDAEVDKVVGLELGADDYITKPFSPREFIARIKAVLRRLETEQAPAKDLIRWGEVSIDVPRREVHVGDNILDFTVKEFDLLVYLVHNRGLVLSRQQILNAVWGYDRYVDTRTVDVHIAQLRSKLGEHLPIHTIRGIGYKVKEHV